MTDLDIAALRKLIADDPDGLPQLTTWELTALLDAAEERDALRAEIDRLQADLTAARADQAAMARRELEAVQSWLFQFRPAGYPNIQAVASFCTDRLAALPQPKLAAEPAPAFEGDPKGCAFPPYTYDEQQALTAAVPPLPIDADPPWLRDPCLSTIQMESDADEQDWRAAVTLALDEMALLIRRALAGKEPKP